MPRGGRRPGSGRKPKADVVQHPSSPLVPEVPVDVDPPAWLDEAGRAVWDVQAPHAIAAKTLTPASAEAFARYCRVSVLERTLAETHPGGSDHRGLLKQINAYELEFLLVPCGKPLPVPVEVVTDADDDFFGSRTA